MDRVAAKVAQEIGVLFEHQHRDPGARQQQPEHHAGGAAPGNAATHAVLAIGHRNSYDRRSAKTDRAETVSSTCIFTRPAPATATLDDGSI